MNKLFDVVGGEVVLNADALALKPFNDLWVQDKSKNKVQATKEISYIVFMHKWDSIYRSAYAPADRVRKVLKDIFGDSNYKIRPEVEVAAERYLELQESLFSRLIKAAQDKVEGIIDIMNNGAIPLTDTIKLMEKIGPIIKSLDILKKQVESEQSGGSRVRGGAEIDIFSVPKATFGKQAKLN